MAIAYLISKRLKGEGGGHMLPPRLHQASDPRDHDRAIVVRRFGATARNERTAASL